MAWRRSGVRSPSAPLELLRSETRPAYAGLMSEAGLRHNRLETYVAGAEGAGLEPESTRVGRVKV